MAAIPATEATPEFATLVRAVADFPSPGIVFRDVMPLLADAGGFAAAIEALAAPWRDAGIGAVAGVEARGFIFAAALARALDAGFVPLRKPGKLPGALHEVEYALEYGRDRLQEHADALPARTRVLLVDAVLATGGTRAAAARLQGALDVELAGAAVLVEIEGLGGRARWPGPAPLVSVLRY